MASQPDDATKIDATKIDANNTKPTSDPITRAGPRKGPATFA